MNSGEVDRVADVLLHGTNRGLDGPVDMRRVVERHLGKGSVQTLPASALPGDGCLCRLHDQWTVYVRSRLPAVRLRFVLGHELAHWALRVGSGSTEDEQLCDAVAACLVAPRQAFECAVRDIGTGLPRLAERFGASQSLVALRLGEVVETPVALLTPESVRVRGAPFAWPTESEMRLTSSGLPVERSRLTDDRRRLVLRALSFRPRAKP